MIKFSTKGNWSKTNSFIEKALNVVKLGSLDKYGEKGVEALAAATPKDSGETAKSWYYQIVRDGENTQIQWCNSAQNDGIPITILIQYGHAFQNGAYVRPDDFINPAIKPIFEEISEEIRKELEQ